MITVLLWLIAAAVLFQPNAPRFFAAFVFVAVTFSHELFMSDLDGLAYYGTAALFDLGIIMLTSAINPVPQMVIDLQKICMASVLANWIGCTLWALEAPPTIYNLAFMVIYAWTFIILTERNSADVGGFRVDSWRSCFRFNRLSCIGYSFRNGGPS